MFLDECNWRNDYPNEDGEDSCSLDSNEEYRHRDVYYGQCMCLSVHEYDIMSSIII